MTTHTGLPRAALPALITCIAALLAGCGSMSGLDGESRYACQAPVGVACNSVSGTYANTNTLPAQRNAPAAALSRPATPDLPAAAPPQVRPPTLPGAPAPRVGARGMGDPDPKDQQSLRSPPRVLRLWTQAWEDRDGDLHDQAYVYLLIDSGQWRMAHIRQQARDSRRTVLTAPAAPAAPAELSNPSNATSQSTARRQTQQGPDKPGDPLDGRPAPTLGEPQRPAPQDIHGATTAPLPPQQPHYPLGPERLRMLRDRP